MLITNGHKAFRNWFKYLRFAPKSNLTVNHRLSQIMFAFDFAPFIRLREIENLDLLIRAIIYFGLFNFITWVLISISAFKHLSNVALMSRSKSTFASLATKLLPSLKRFGSTKNVSIIANSGKITKMMKNIIILMSNLKLTLPEDQNQIANTPKAKRRKLQATRIMDNITGGLLLGSCCSNLLILSNRSLE